MRKFVLILLSLLTPFGIWSAGCRQETARAPMPKGPETARLARAPGAGVDAGIATPPNIPALIDPEILATPDQPTFARIRAVMDREESLAGNMADPGLFVLPRQDYYPEMAVAPQPVAPQPAPLAAPEFWSRPVQDMPVGSPRQNLSPDLAAMAPGVVANPPPAHRFEAYPAYAMPDDSGLTPLAPMVPHQASPLSPPPMLPPPPAPTAPPARPANDMPAEIPGLYFGPDDLILPEVSSGQGAESPGGPAAPDFFDNPDLGLLASVTSLDDLTSLFLAEAPRPAETAAPPPIRPTQEISRSPTPPSGLLDFSVSKLVNTPPSRPARPEAEPAIGDLDTLAALPVSLDIPEPAGTAAREDVADRPLFAETPALAPAVEEISPPPLLSLDSFSGDRGFADPAAAGPDGADTATWDAFRPPVKLDRQSAVLDPLIDYDFSAFARREEKQPAQKVKLTPAEGRPERGRTYSVEPEAPPLL